MQSSSNDKNLSSSITQRMPWAINTKGAGEPYCSLPAPARRRTQSGQRMEVGQSAPLPGEANSAMIVQLDTEIKEEARQPLSPS